jgi:hypothetical protein
MVQAKSVVHSYITVTGRQVTKKYARRYILGGRDAPVNICSLHVHTVRCIMI